MLVGATNQIKENSSPPFIQNQPQQINYNYFEKTLIQLKFKNGLNIRLRNGRLIDLDGRALQTVQAINILHAVKDGKWTRGSSLDEATITSLNKRAKKRSGQTVSDFNLVFRLKLPPAMDVNTAITLFQSLDEVEWVTSVPKPAPQPPSPPDYLSSNDGNFDSTLNRNTYQRYLDAAPDGLNFRYAWDGLGGTAAGIKICDVEYGWNSSHTDLPTVTVLGGEPDPSNPSNWWEHGTAVIGELAALNNDWGVTGMAYGADIYFAASDTPDGGYNIADAITRCANSLALGDVILIEQQISGPNRPSNPATGDQTGLIPVEWDVSSYDAIKTAVALGIIVVEAAGNGNQNLDAAEYCPNASHHCPFKTGNDSGAIIVGGSDSPYRSSPRSKNSSSNYGATVDLQGWGNDILSAGYGTYYSAEGQNLWYRRNFGGTSGASPMVTSAAAIVQANYKLKTGSAATPATVKSLLKNTGTAQVGSQNIGQLPDLEAAINSIWGFTTPAAPTISPTGGTYNMPMQIYIAYGNGSQNYQNSNIRYTVDGSEPTADSFIYIPEFDTNGVYVNYGVTVKAKAFQYDSTAKRSILSNSSSVTYLSSTPKVAPPQISPSGGFYNQPHQVTITTNTAGATIKYRTDGRSPSFFYPGTTYSGIFTLNPGSYNIKARAYKDGYYKSDLVSSGEIVVNPTTLPAPTIYPNGGDVAGEANIYLGSTVLGADIHYTLDGSNPTSTSSVYVNTIVLTQSSTIKAITRLTGYTNSPATSATFNVIGQVATPTISPGSKTAFDSVSVTISTSTPNAEIRYTTNGSEPNIYSTLYTGAFAVGIGQQQIVRAKAFLSNATPSNEAATSYDVYDSTLSVAIPVVTPHSGNFNGPLTVTITSDTQGSFISYTTDATDPKSSPTVKAYSGPFVLYGNDTYYIRARAYKAGIGQSNMSTLSTLTIVTPTLGTVATPTLSLPAGTYTNTFTLKVYAPDHKKYTSYIRRLFISTDGLTPTVDFTGGSFPHPSLYYVNVSLSKPTTVKAIAGQAAWFDSPGISADYEFVCDTPTISPNSGTFTDTATVSMSSGTSIAKIYYTTNGEEPISTATATNTLYSTPFALSTGLHPVKAKCFRTNFDASNTAISMININLTPVTPVITTPPANQTVQSGEVVTFTAVITAIPNASYQWQKDNINIAGEAEANIVIPAARLANAGDYRLTANNKAGFVTSTVATLIVNPINTSLSINQVANTASITSGNRISYTLTLTNSGSVSSTAQIVDTLTPASAITAISSDHSGCQAVNGVVTCTIGLTNTVPTTLHLYVDTSASYSGTLTTNATITGTGEYLNTNANNSSKVTVKLFNNLSVAILKTATPSTAYVGQVITYTYRMTNTGNLSLTNIIASDDKLGTVTMDTITLSSGTTSTGILTYTLRTGELPTLVNTVIVTGTSPAGQKVVASYSASVVVLNDITPPTFPITNSRTGTPLITPTLGITIATAKPTFDWEDAADNIGIMFYTIVITNDGNQLNIQASDQATTTQSNFTPTNDLPNGVYTWTVTAHDMANNLTNVITPATFSVDATVTTNVNGVYLPVIIK